MTEDGDQVGQRLLTSSLEEVLVLQVKDISLFLVSCGEKEFILSPYEIFAVILDVTSPETEDVGYVQLRVEDTRKNPPHFGEKWGGFFSFRRKSLLDGWSWGSGTHHKRLCLKRKPLPDCSF